MPGFRGEQATLPLHRWQQFFEVLLTDSRRAPCDRELDVWHDFHDFSLFYHLLFFSRSLQPLLDLPSAASEEGFGAQESVMVTWKKQSVVATSWAKKTHVCEILLYIGHRGLHPACHLVSFGLLVFWKLLAPSLWRGPMSPHSTSSYVKPSGLVEQTLPLDPFEKVNPLEKRGYNLQKQSNGWKPFEGRVDAFLKSLLTPLTAVFLWSQWHMGCCSET